MPLIFAENDETESGIEYSDKTGVSYQFPQQYRRAIQPGERFIYYRGRKKHGGGRQPQIYFGAGIVGNVSADADDITRLVCEVLDYKPFPIPVPFKDANSHYLEFGGNRRGYFQRGVRKVTELEFERILKAGEVEGGPATEPAAINKSGSGYASGEFLKAIERYAVDAALAILRARFPDVPIIEQIRNNPGFDILVKHASGDAFVEVKGTSGKLPLFIMTEGEVKFSIRNAVRYSLLVVHNINLASHSHKVFEHLGAITDDTFVKEPLQWRCGPIR